MRTLDADEYRAAYYADEFVFGLGTEEVLDHLADVPPVGTWIDLGSGSESLLWGTALDAKRLIAVDADPARLEMLEQATGAPEPRGAYRTALELSGRAPGEWPALCARLAGTRVADCLSGRPPVEDRAELVTQFGLLGLCRDIAHFQASFAAIAALAEPGGWLAGANWVAADLTGRVELRERDYRRALAAAGATPLVLRRIPSADPAYPAVWCYVARKGSEGPA